MIAAWPPCSERANHAYYTIDEKSVMFYVVLYFLVPGTYVLNLNFFFLNCIDTKFYYSYISV